MSQNGALFMQLGIIVVFFIIFYAVLLVPEKKRKKKYAQMLDDLKVNDQVVTRGGIVGKVIKVDDEFMVVESGPDRVRIKMSKRAVSTVTPREEQTSEN